MFKKTLIAGAIAAALAAPGVVFAADAAPAEAKSPHTITGNFGIFTQYIFRGLTQTNGSPAAQGGFDYSHSSGLYAGTWLSNISWLMDSPAVTGYSSSSLELDMYGGYKGTFGASDFGYDVGVLKYYYPGTHILAGTVRADTLEAYGAVTWKWLSLKYSHSLNNTFGVANSNGTYYLDLTAAYPLTEQITLVAHYGNQKFEGSTGAFDNNANASYEDYKLGVSYLLPKDFTIGGYFTGTSMNAVQKAFYTNTSNTRFMGKDTFTVFVQKTF